LTGLIVGFVFYTTAWFIAEIVTGVVYCTYAKFTIKNLCKDD